MAIVVMICFARSGGTVLNQCLGSLPNVVVLSEVNPLGQGGGKNGLRRTVKQQAKDWYDIEIESDNFLDGVLELHNICSRSEKTLIIRDWPYVNFVPIDQNEFNAPNKLLLLERLENKVKVIPFAFVRDAIDVWLSRRFLEMDAFFDAYPRFLNEILQRNIRIFKYEQFCSDPSGQIRAICEHTGLTYSESFKNYASFTKVNGDVHIKLGSRGPQKRSIRPLGRKIILRRVAAKLNACQSMVECNHLLGYPESYYDVPRESFTRMLYTVAQRQMNRFFR